MHKLLHELGATLLAITCVTQAIAKDLNSLAAFVQPAYVAMNFAVMCARDSPLFLANTSGPRGTVLNYAKHVKDEAIEFLSELEASVVLKSAANAARLTARQKLHELARPGDHSGTALAIRNWCEREGRHFVLEFIRSHDETHADIVRFLELAKR